MQRQFDARLPEGASPLPRRRGARAVLAAACVAAGLLLGPLLNARAQPPALLPLPPFTIVVDPGHGGDDHGAVGSSGLEEKELALAVAQQLQTLAAARGTLQVRLTRGDDRALTLEERAAAANAAPANLFVSLHANFSPSPRSAGVEVGTFRRMGPPADVGTATRSTVEPALGAEAASDVTLVPWEQAQARHLDRASTVAQRLMEGFRAIGAVGPRGWYQGPLRPLAAVNMPAVLVELGFLSNTDDETALRTDARRQQLAQALLDVVSALSRGGAVVTEAP